MQLTVEPIWGWGGVVLVTAGLIALLVFMDRVQLRKLSTPRRRWLLGLKSAACLLIILAMFRPAVVTTETSENTVQLLVAVDVSRSMTTPDGPGGVTRWKALQDDLERASSLWKKFAEKAEIRQFEFDRQLRPRQDDRKDADGPMTAIGASAG